MSTCNRLDLQTPDLNRSCPKISPDTEVVYALEINACWLLVQGVPCTTRLNRFSLCLPSNMRKLVHFNHVLQLVYCNLW